MDTLKQGGVLLSFAIKRLHFALNWSQSCSARGNLTARVIRFAQAPSSVANVYTMVALRYK